MTPSEKIFASSLRSRADRLIRLIDLNAPIRILCGEVFLVFKAGAALSPKILGGLVGEFVATSTRRDMGVCIENGCGEVVGHQEWETHKAEMCETHATQAQREVDEMEEDGEDRRGYE